MNYSKYFLAAAAAAVLASPAAAAPQASGKALILVPLSLTKVDDLDFGTVVTSASAGTVTIPADGTTRTKTGGVTLVTSDPGFRAVFAGAGSANQLVDLALSAPPTTVDDGSGNSMPISLQLEATTATVDPVTRAFQVGVGGTVDVGANQVEGVYTAIFTVDANYQ